MNRRLALGLLGAVFLLALALRLPELGRRPLHNDEAVNASKLAALLTGGRYAYDPHEYHGPSLHYLSLPFVLLAGATSDAQLTDARLRLVTVAFGAGLVLCLGLFAPGLGWRAVLWAALFTAVSPAMVFYSRYFIHELLLVFFTTVFLGAGWLWFESRKYSWLTLSALALGMMYATKETFVLSLAATGCAAGATWLNEHFLPTRPPPAGRRSRGPLFKPVLLATGIAVGIGILFFTSFFTNPRGPLDSLLTYLPWLNRAGGASPHLHGWNFYFERLFWHHPDRSPVWTEALLGLLALVGAAQALRGRLPKEIHSQMARFLAFYTGAVVCAYLLIPYKTPWCLLNFWQPALLLGGVGVLCLQASFRSRAGQTLIWLALIAGMGHLFLQSWRAATTFTADRRNPYTYSQTAPDVRALVERVQAIAKVHPDGTNLVVQVISPESYWPLPWYLRELRFVGWYETPPAQLEAPVIIASTRTGLTPLPNNGHQWLSVGIFPLRPGVYLELWVDFELWKRVVPTLPKDRDE